MVDERLSEAERRWRQTGADEDRRAFLRERVRAFGLTSDLARLSVLEFDPEVTRAAVTALLESSLPRLRAAYDEARAGRPDRSGRRAAWQRAEDAWSPIYDELSVLLREVGPWIGPWIDPSYLRRSFDTPLQAASIPTVVERLMHTVVAQHAHRQRLHVMFDQVTLTLDTPELLDTTLRGATKTLVDFAVRETHCEDAWYDLVSELLGDLLEFKDVRLPESVLDSFSEIVHGPFDSWCAPTDEAVRVVADGVALAVVRAMFAERYGAP
jgi:hypothetical protein